jgi:hypothetical protein
LDTCIAFKIDLLAKWAQEPHKGVAVLADVTIIFAWGYVWAAALYNLGDGFLNGKQWATTTG